MKLSIINVDKFRKTSITKIQTVMKKLQLSTLILILLASTIYLGSCSKDEPFASVSINEVGSDLGGDVTGDGGSIVESYNWNNPLSTVDWNMDITTVSGGTFNLKIVDSDGTTVLDQALTAGQGDDSRSGVSAAGTSGQWTITVRLTSFNGDGSFSISPGD
jgi:hypothetical protein